MKIFPVIVLLTALILSGTAATFSIIGLMAIFASATLSIAIMGTAMEVGKIVSVVWLHKYWDEASKLLKTYLSVGVVVLTLITSVGIFGLLSKAHLDQTQVVSVSQVSIDTYQNTIKFSENAIERNQERIKALEDTLAVYLKYDMATKSLQKREELSEELEYLESEIQKHTQKIEEATQSLVPLLKQQKEYEVEVGPIRYVAELIYGDEATSHFEDAVKILIIMLIFVFDPLALCLLIASQSAFRMEGGVPVPESNDLPSEEELERYFDQFREPVFDDEWVPENEEEWMEDDKDHPTPVVKPKPTEPEIEIETPTEPPVFEDNMFISEDNIDILVEKDDNVRINHGRQSQND